MRWKIHFTRLWASCIKATSFISQNLVFQTMWQQGKLMCRFHIVPDHKFLSALKTFKRNIPYYVETSQLFCRALANRWTGMMDNVIVKSVNILKSEAEFFFFSFFSVYYILSFKNPEKLLPSTIFNPLTHDVYKKVKHT